MTSDRLAKLQKLQALCDEFAVGLPDRLANIREAALGLSTDSAGTLSAEGTLRRLVHNLAGAGGTFGHQALSQEARWLEMELTALEGAPPLSKQGLARIEESLQRLESLVRSGVSAGPAEELIAPPPMPADPT